MFPFLTRHRTTTYSVTPYSVLRSRTLPYPLPVTVTVTRYRSSRYPLPVTVPPVTRSSRYRYPLPVTRYRYPFPVPPGPQDQRLLPYSPQGQLPLLQD